MPGYVPRRNVSAGHTGAWPAPGNSSVFLWADEPWDYDALPRTFDPPKGFVASANNQVPPREWPYFLTADWDGGSDGYRAERITNMIAGETAHSVDSVARAQTDYVSLFARDVGAAVAAAATTTTPGGAWVRAWLSTSWDHSLPVGSWEATLWADVRKRLMVLGAAETGGAVWDNPVFLLNALYSDASGTGSDPACAAAGFASCAAFSGAALDAAAARFGIGAEGTTGDGIAKWGVDVHRAAITHEVLKSSPLACVADRVVAHGGEDFTVNVGSYDFDDDTMTQKHGPSVRHIMDLADPAAIAGGAEAASRWMQPLGQEGDVLSPAYDALLARWATGEYMVMTTVEGEGGGVVSLVPV